MMLTTRSDITLKVSLCTKPCRESTLSARRRSSTFLVRTLAARMSSLHEQLLGVPSPWAPVSELWLRLLASGSLLSVSAPTHLKQDPTDQRHPEQHAQSDAEHCKQLVHGPQFSASPWVQLLWQISATTQTTRAKVRAAAKPKTRNPNHSYPSMLASG